MFTLKGRVASNSSTDIEDSAIVKMALTALGYYDDTKSGLSPYGDQQLFQSIAAFQKDHNLKIDSMIKPDGPTQKTIKERLQAIPQALGAFGDFIGSWKDMKEANTINADKYFHCKANYQATSRGWPGKTIAEDLSDIREVYGQNVKGDPASDQIADQKANHYGRRAAVSGNYESAEDACAIYRPDGLDEKY